MAERHGIAQIFSPACYVSNWRVSPYGPYSSPLPEKYLSLPDDLPDYNGGVLFLHRKHPKVADLLPELVAKLRKEIDWKNLQTNPALNDQSALSILIYEKGICPYVLPHNWNLRYQMTSGFGPVKIWHSRDPVADGVGRSGEGYWRVEHKDDGRSVLHPMKWFHKVTGKRGRVLVDRD